MYVYIYIYEQALVCLYNKQILGVSRGQPIHCKMANNRIIRAGGLLVDGTAEEHLRIGALADTKDVGAPLER